MTGISKEERARRAATQGVPPSGGAVQAAETGSVNPQVMRMTGHGSEEEMASSLPTNTMELAADETPKRKRRSKAEMAAGKETPSVDPLLDDRRYQAAIAKASAFGTAKGIKSGFRIAGKIANDESLSLDGEEEKDLDDFFYALSKRRALADPFATWYGTLLYFFVMMATLIGSRFATVKGASFQKSLAEMFGFGEKEKPEGEPKEHA